MTGETLIEEAPLQDAGHCPHDRRVMPQPAVRAAYADRLTWAAA